MLETRFLKLVIIALLLLNAGTLGYLLLHHPEANSPSARNERDPRGTAAFLDRELHLSAAQEREYKQLRDGHHDAVEAIRRQMKEQQARIYRFMSAVDTAGQGPKIGASIDSIAAEQRRIELITFEHFKDFRKLCTPAQQQRFDEVIQEALSRL